MRFNRPLLYAGAFLAVVGGIAVAADAGYVDTATLVTTLSFWPVAVIGLGVALVARRTPAAVIAGLLAAALPGVLVGSAFSILPRFAGDCGAITAPTAVAAESGAFVGAAYVEVRTGCGSMQVTTSPGSGWAVAAASTANRRPTIESDGQLLSVSGVKPGWGMLGAGRDEWNLTLPTSAIDVLDVTANAGRSRLALEGARVATLDLVGNLSDVIVDATGASIETLTARLNMSNLSLHLPANADLTGSIRIGGGTLEICAPPGLGLSVWSDGYGPFFRERGFKLDGPSWVSPGYDSAAHRADLQVDANFATVSINPTGGCR